MARQSIAVIGAGLMGMCVARKLALDGHKVTVMEGANQVGGLATWQDFGEFQWDRFYHVILPSDKHLIGLLRQLNLEESLHWRRTFTGFYVNYKLFSISNNIEFLTFPLLSPISKIRLAWTLFYGSRVNNWRKLEKITTVDWLMKVSGQKTYENFWKPLLLAKLGTNYTRVSAVFIWSYIKRMFSARDKSANAEHLGFVQGGYRTVFDCMQSHIVDAGGSVVTSAKVQQINASENGRLSVKTDTSSTEYDKVICTSPVSVVNEIVDNNLLQTFNQGAQVEYLGVVCLVLITTTPISPYYVINIADGDIPFTGVIGLTNVVSLDNTAGYHVTYLPRYILSTDPILQQSDSYFQDSFLAGILKMFPKFDSNSIVSLHVTRAGKVQPLQVVDYSTIVPNVETQHPDLYLLNTAQFFNATLNNNEVVGVVEKFYQQHASELASES